jgi:hypothetical protein
MRLKKNVVIHMPHPPLFCRTEKRISLRRCAWQLAVGPVAAFMAGAVAPVAAMVSVHVCGFRVHLVHLLTPTRHGVPAVL